MSRSQGLCRRQGGLEEREERGFALLVVLWLVVVLGFLAGEVVMPTRFDAATAFNDRCRAIGHYAARAGVAEARERLSGAIVEPSPDGRPAGFLVPGSLGGEPGRETLDRFAGAVGKASYRVEVVDINSRVNVNRADASVLRGFFANAGVEANRAGALADAILDWIDPDDLRRAQGAEAEAYGGGHTLPRNGPIPVLDELRHVRGMSPELLYGPRGRGGGEEGGGIARWLTVEGSGRVNVNTAALAVLAALPGFTSDVVAIVDDLRRGGGIRSISQIAADPRLVGGPMALQDAAMRILETTTTRSEEARVRAVGFAPGCRLAAGIDALVVAAPEGTGTEVMAWREWLPPAVAREAEP